MTLSAVATRYAKALADVTTAASGLRPDDALSQLRAFESALGASRELENALSTPAVPGSRKRAVVGRIADLLKLSPIARNFLFVLIDHRRIALLGAILHSFELIVDERLGFARAEVSSPRGLTETQRGAINAQLERLTGKRIRTRFAVDPALIGGVVARIGSTVYDGSVRGQLQTLGRRLSTER
ncbi:MAG: ATP synthase F1 subunit delta [Candidatus Solibacter sp.]|nr:ATP synthase F1 subunit delta [Candidatus Solibacter sp.]